MTAPARSARPDEPAMLILFSKRPQPGVGKQRIAATLGTQVACALAERLFDCALEDLAAWPGETAICIAEPQDIGWARARAPDARVIAQGDGNLGERLSAATDTLGTQRPLLFIGCDAPTLSNDYLARASVALLSADVILGGAEDGGVVVMGCRRGWPALDGLPWSTRALGAALKQACKASGRSVTSLPDHADVDTAADLPAVCAALHDDRRPARQALRDWLIRHQLDSARHIA